MYKFLIADDHLIVLMGIERLVEKHFPGAEIHLVESFEDALILVQKVTFDLIILDINLPGGNRIAMIESLRLRQPGVKVLIFSAFEENQYAASYMKAGADGYLAKRSSKEEIYNAIHAILQNKKYLSPHMQQLYIERLLRDEDPFLKALDKLSQKELEVMRMLVSGLPTNEIAAKLSVSAPAISGHKSKIFEKLAVNNVVELKDLLANMDW